MARLPLRAAIVALVGATLIGVGLAPSSQAQTLQRGSSTITTAPGLIANADRISVTFTADSPATSRLNNPSLSSRTTQALIRFPVRSIGGPGQYSLSGSLVIRNSSNGRSVTLQDIVIDMRTRQVSAGVREFFGIRIDAFTITDPGKTTVSTRRTSQKRIRTTTITGATLAISQSVGNQVNQALGLSGSDAIFTPGTALGTANLRVVTSL